MARARSSSQRGASSSSGGGARGFIDGMKGAREALQELSRATQRNVGKRALKAPAALLAAAVKAAAPVSARSGNKTPGSLKASVGTRDTKAQRGTVRRTVIADDVAAVPTEFGLANRKYAAKPWFRPAVDANREAAARSLAEGVKIEIEAVAARAARKAAKAK